MSNSTSTLLPHALAAHRAGKLNDAQALYLRILESSPDLPDPHHLLGLIHLATGDTAAAIGSIARAIALAGTRTPPAFHQNIGKAQFAAGDFPAAVRSFESALALRGDDADLLSEAAAAYIRANNPDAAIAVAARALTLNPRHVPTLINQGVAFNMRGDLDRAEAAFHQAILIESTSTDAWLGLGGVHRHRGDVEKAIDAFRRANLTAPARVEPHLEIARTLIAADRFTDAAATLEAAIAAHASPELWREYAVCLFHAGRLDEASDYLSRAIAARPDFADAHYSLGVVEAAHSGPHTALPHYERALALAPDFPEALVNAAESLRSTGQTEAALPRAHRAVDLRPGSSLLHSSLLYGMHYSANTTRDALLDEHRRWSARHVDPLLSAAATHENLAQPGRRLRIGYVSPDFYYHPAARYVLPVLKHHDHDAFEIFLYGSNARDDYVTAQCRTLSDQFRNVRTLSDEQLAHAIRRDQVDILVDLSLHMAENRQCVFARKPAPIQFCMIGYPSTSGNPAIDYRLSDHFIEPENEPALNGPEQIARVAAPYTFWCFDPHDDHLPPRDPPAQKKGHVTFGSLNNPAKTSDVALDHWCSMLRAVPTSRMLLLAHRPPDHDLLNSFRARGIDPGRIQFSPRVSRHDYLQLYHHVDIALDPYPYTGHSTSFDALYMGVPLLTHRPNAEALPVSKAGISALHALQLPQLLAPTAAALAYHAAALAGDLSALADLSRSLRDRMHASPLMDAVGYTRAIESLYRAAWTAWCHRA